MEMRRLEFTAENEEQKKKFLELVDSKNLSREDLILIISSLKLNDSYLEYLATESSK